MITNLYIKLPKIGNSLKILSDFGIIQAKYKKLVLKIYLCYLITLSAL